MKYQSFLIKYAEIGIKGKNRHIFEEALVRQIKHALKPCEGNFAVHRTYGRQIKHALKPCEGNFAVHRTYGRVFVECLSDYDYSEVTEALSRVFGISGICPIVETPVVPIEELRKAAADFMKEEYPEREATFKVHARRLNKEYPLDSMKVNEELGEAVLDACPNLTVDVHNPEIMLHVEIREKIYIYSTIIPGPGGLPVGVGGKAMLLLSGGIDSPVAGYMIAKRGVKLDAVYFNAPPYTSERALQKVVDLASQVAAYTGPIWLHNINFTEIQLYIYEKCPHDELTIIMRRFMMRIAERLAKESECLALITGESIGQVASQTMTALGVTNEVCTLPVFRPLIGFDKEEIVKVSKKIGTFETSILPYEDCCTIFVAKHPVTKPRLDVIKRHERNLDEKIDEMVERAIATDEIMIVGKDETRIVKQRDGELQI